MARVSGFVFLLWIPATRQNQYCQRVRRYMGQSSLAYDPRNSALATLDDMGHPFLPRLPPKGQTAFSISSRSTCRRKTEQDRPRAKNFPHHGQRHSNRKTALDWISSPGLASQKMPMLVSLFMMVGKRATCELK